MALKFISVIDALRAIQKCVAVNEPPHSSGWSPRDDEERTAHGVAAEFWERCEPQLDEARRYAEAARSLNEALHNGTEETKPRWVQYVADLRFATGEGQHGEIAQRQGVAILAHASRAHHHQAQRIREHTRQYPDPCAVELPWNPRFVIAPIGLFTRLNYVGFDRERLVPFLCKRGIRHALSDEVPASPAPRRAGTEDQNDEVPASPTPRRTWTEDQKLKLLGEYDDGRGATQAELGRRYGVTGSFIGKLLRQAGEIRDARALFPTVRDSKYRR